MNDLNKLPYEELERLLHQIDEQIAARQGRMTELSGTASHVPELNYAVVEDRHDEFGRNQRTVALLEAQQRAIAKEMERRERSNRM